MDSERQAQIDAGLWVYVYECRMCANAFLGSTESMENVHMGLCEMINGDRVHSRHGIGTARFRIHRCPNGDLGFADLVGARAFE